MSRLLRAARDGETVTARLEDPAALPTVTMVAPSSDRPCGVADYTAYLLAALPGYADVRFVTDADHFTPAMNAVDLAHIQHQYFLFGGVAPWKCRFRQFADRLRAPAVMTVHEFVPPEGSLVRRAAIGLSNRLHFRHPAVRRLLVHTAWDRERLMRAGLPAGRIEVVRHGVPPAPALPAREQARRALDLDNAFIVTVFGFLSRRKGHRLAIEALRRLPAEVMLLLAGGRHPDDRTNYVQELMLAIQQNHLADRVRITGYLPAQDAAAVMSATDLVLAPFVESSGSGSLAYAFACGRPLLASDIPPHREIREESPGALALFPAHDPERLAGAIEALRADGTARAALAEGARAYAGMRSYERMAQETAAVYRRVLAEARPCA